MVRAASPIQDHVERLRPATRWMALAGTVMYLLEFVFIFSFWKMWPEAASPMELVEFGEANKTAVSIATSGVSIAILGRVIFASAIRDWLRQRPRLLALADIGWALAVMSVTVEIVALTFTGISARMAATTESAATIAYSLMQSYMVDASVPILLGASAIVFSLALIRGGLLKPWIGWVGLVGGVGFAASVAAPFDSIRFLSDSIAPVGWLLVVVWMFAASISLLRAGTRSSEPE